MGLLEWWFMKLLLRWSVVKYPGAPVWVNVIYKVCTWIDYKLSRFGSKFSYFAYELLDRHCKCEKCERRRKDGI